MGRKLFFLLTILYVSFKFGEPALVMMSIYGDSGFFFDSANVAPNDLVGFVYDNSNGGVSTVNCTVNAKTTSFTLKSDCTVESTVAVTIADTAIATALKEEAVADFPVAKVNTNMIVAQPTNPFVTAKTKAEFLATSPMLTIKGTISSSSTADQGASTFLCNSESAADSETHFVINGNAGTTTFLELNEGSNTTFSAVLKCVAAIRNAESTTQAWSSFIMLITDHKDLTGRFNSLAFPSIVALPPSISNPTNSSINVGIINGKKACPSNASFEITPSSSTPCKGIISVPATSTNSSYLTFSYSGKIYYLNVTGADSNTTCSSFAFTFKYSNILIGMLLIFMSKILKYC